MKPRLLLDLSVITNRDDRSGIQRVLRETIAGLIAVASDRYSLVPIVAGEGGYRAPGRLELDGLVLGDGVVEGPLEPLATDVYLGIEIFLEGPGLHEDFFRRLKEAGAGVYFVVHDLLPLMRPECFDAPMQHAFGVWLEGVSKVADGLICTTETVADQVVEWLRLAAPERAAPLRIGRFQPGHDIGNTGPEVDSKPVPDGPPTFLMVGTLEPRKAHRQALEAFELLWSRGVDAHLVIAGRTGWSVEELADRLANHPEQGKRLRWKTDAGDDQLNDLYRSSTALLAASEGEGFGLPMIEAAAFGLPLIARELPVFREVAGDNAFYFAGDSAEDLAGAIVEWMELNDRAAAPQPDGIARASWQQSAEQILSLIENGDWYRIVQPPPRPASGTELPALMSYVSIGVQKALEASGLAAEPAISDPPDRRLLDDASQFLAPPREFPPGTRLISFRKLRRRLAEFLIVPQAEYNSRILRYLRQLKPSDAEPEITELRISLSTLRHDLDALRRQLEEGSGSEEPPAES